MLLNFDDFRWGGPLEDGYGYVTNCTLNATGGSGGKPSIRTTALGVGSLNNGVYEGFPSQHRTGIKGVRSNFNVANAGTFSLIEVWQGDWVVKVVPNGTSLEVWRYGGAGGASLVFTATSAISAGTFRWVELKWTVSSLDSNNTLQADGSVALYVNRSLVNSQSGLVIGRTIEPGFVRDVQWNVIVVNPHGDVDYHYLCDGSGTMNTDVLPANINMYTVFPQTGNGTFTELTPSTGTDQGALVDDTVSDGDTTYLSATGVARKSSFNFSDFSSIGSQRIYGLKQVASGKKTESGYRRFRPFIYRDAVIQYAATDYNVGVGYFNWQSHVWELDPHTGTFFQLTDVNNAEYGTLIG